jgi:integrase
LYLTNLFQQNKLDGQFRYLIKIDTSGERGYPAVNKIRYLGLGELLLLTFGFKESHHSKGITSGTFYGNLQRYFKKAGITPSGVHIFRHTAAKLRRDVGETVEDVSRFLDHSSLAVTTVYLRRLEGEQDKSWAKVAKAIGCNI